MRLCTLEAVEGRLCLLEVLEVSEAIRRVLLCMPAAVEGRLCLMEVLEVLGGYAPCASLHAGRSGR